MFTSAKPSLKLLYRLISTRYDGTSATSAYFRRYFRHRANPDFTGVGGSTFSTSAYFRPYFRRHF
ncbi:hypothetical protein [EBPR siphovirus 5]|nr:hypothetical protein [EBPR siphovirus 5]